MCVFVCMCVCLYVCVCVCMYMCVCMYVCLYVCVCVCMYVCECVCLYVSICVCVCVHVCVYVNRFEILLPKRLNPKICGRFSDTKTLLLVPSRLAISIWSSLASPQYIFLATRSRDSPLGQPRDVFTRVTLPDPSRFARSILGRLPQSVQ